MFHHLLPGLVLLCCFKGSSSDPPVRVMVNVGQDVILPCNYSINTRSDMPVVEWSKDKLKPNVTFLYRDGCETFEMKHPDFEYRTNLLMKELKAGNISLRISNVQLSDAGIFRCLRIWTSTDQEYTLVKLIVVSEPKLSVVFSESAELTLECEARDCLEVPEITFLDDEGMQLSAEEPRREPDARGCYIVKQRIILQSTTSRVTCRVHQPENKQNQEARIAIPAAYIKDNFKIPFFIVISVLIIVSALAICLCWRLYKSVNTLDGPNSGNQSLCWTSINVNNVGNCNCAALKEEVARLKETLHDETISQLKKSSKSTMRPVVCHITQPTIPCSSSRSSSDVAKTIKKDTSSPTNDIPKLVDFTLPKSLVLQNQGPGPLTVRQIHNPAPERHIQKLSRSNSTPAPSLDQNPETSSSSFSCTRRKLCQIGRSMSEGSPQPAPVYSKAQRRLSCVVLANVGEETDPLLQ